MDGNLLTLPTKSLYNNFYQSFCSSELAEKQN
ncbi:MAG: hypothetical protein ACTS73_06015 [Arsenophonus sp. NEOnobi-MAG3]